MLFLQTSRIKLIYQESFYIVYFLEAADISYGRRKQSQSQRKKPELRVDTGVASRMEEGRNGQGGQKKRGDWKDLFRAL